MRHSRLAAPVLLGAFLLAGCGGGADEARKEPTRSTDLATSTAPSTPATPATSSAPTPTPTPTADEGGNGDAEDDDTPATAGGGICGRLSADEVGEVLGGTVSGAALPGGGCEFTQANRRAPAVTFVDKRFSSMQAAKDEANSTVEGVPEDLDGIGTEAFVVTGTAFGEDQIQGAGGVHAGSRMISVMVNQQQGLATDKVRGLVVASLRLVVQER